MFKVQLFLGFPVDPIYAKKLEDVNPYLLSQFIQGSDEYLKDVIQDDVRYFGKQIQKIESMSQLDLLEGNVFSLLKRLVPEYPYDETSLYLFSINSNG